MKFKSITNRIMHFSMANEVNSLKVALAHNGNGRENLTFRQRGAMVMDNMIAVGFIAMLLIGVVASIPTINHKLSVSQFQKQEAEIASAAVSWKKQRSNYDELASLKTLCDRQLLDKSICGTAGTGAASNPFGGDWSIKGDKGTFAVTAVLANLDATQDLGRILDLKDTMAPSTRMQCSSAEGCTSLGGTGNTIIMTH